jgi:hypothetical protein
MEQKMTKTTTQNIRKTYDAADTQKDQSRQMGI